MARLPLAEDVERLNSRFAMAIASRLSAANPDERDVTRRQMHFGADRRAVNIENDCQEQRNRDFSHANSPFPMSGTPSAAKSQEDSVFAI